MLAWYPAAMFKLRTSVGVPDVFESAIAWPALPVKLVNVPKLLLQDDPDKLAFNNPGTGVAVGDTVYGYVLIAVVPKLCW